MLRTCTIHSKFAALALCIGALTACEKHDDDNTRSTRNDAVSVAPDNAKKNKRDRDEQAVTPFDQGNSESDLNITQGIRQKVMAQNNLSVNAQNVKIITQQGDVTLRGPVESAEERALIETLARAQTGVKRLTNDIEITRKEEANNGKE